MARTSFPKNHKNESDYKHSKLFIQGPFKPPPPPPRINYSKIKINYATNAFYCGSPSMLADNVDVRGHAAGSIGGAP
jgi:hypothetical protein